MSSKDDQTQNAKENRSFVFLDTKADNAPCLQYLRYSAGGWLVACVSFFADREPLFEIGESCENGALSVLPEDLAETRWGPGYFKETSGETFASVSSLFQKEL